MPAPEAKVVIPEADEIPELTSEALSYFGHNHYHEALEAVTRAYAGFVKLEKQVDLKQLGFFEGVGEPPESEVRRAGYIRAGDLRWLRIMSNVLRENDLTIKYVNEIMAATQYWAQFENKPGEAATLQSLELHQFGPYAKERAASC